MKRLYSAFCAVLFFCAAVLPADASNDTGTSAASAILFEPTTETVLFEKDADSRLPMASTTKIMTALVALEAVPLETKVAVPDEACGMEGSGIGLTPGEELTVEDLLWAVLLESANDAAAATAIAVSGSIAAFADRMNEKAVQLGLTDTHFANPHGLDDEAHYTTARDLAKITASAMENDTFRKMVSSVRHEIPKPNGTRYLINHNRLLRERSDVIGVKTGFTKHSGRCLVTAAERDGVCLIAVTLNDPDDWRDHCALYDAVFPRCTRIRFAEPGGISFPVPCVGSEKGAVRAVNDTGLERVFIDGRPEYRTVIETKRMLFPPVECGEEIGRAVFLAPDGSELGSVPLLADETVSAPEEPEGLLRKLFSRG